MKKTPLACAFLCAAAALGADVVHDARLLRFPDIHGDTIVFSHGGDLWAVSASGGSARRLTSGDGLKVFPRFSPDGKWIAFTGQYDGTFDVYVMPAEGGAPRRLTWYPSQENNERMGYDNMVIGWTPDGRVLFRSQRGPIAGFIGQPYTVSPDGGPVARFPLPESGIISFAPDGQRIAYTRIFRDFRTWKRYQGGLAQDVSIYDLGKKTLERITDWVGTDTDPMWVGNAIYFISDRENWKLNLWRYDLGTKQTARATDFKEFDVKWAHSGSGKIVFENGGFLYLLDPVDGQPRKVAVDLPDDRRLARTHWVNVDDKITEFGLAPGGKRALFVARGDVFTVPVEHGNTRNLTDSQGVRERDAIWSPDGRWVAYVSDATGEEELEIVAQDGKAPPIRVTSGPSAWHFPPVWSPDSKKLAYADRSMRLFYVDVQEKKPVLVDKAEIFEITQYAWSPDSKWLCFANQTDNTNPALFLYSLDTRSLRQITSDTVPSYEPRFDPDGKYLFFLSDRDSNATLGNFELSYTVNKITRPHAILLRADVSSPFAPQSDEVKVGEEKPKEPPKDDGRETKDKDAKEKGEEPKKAKKEPFRIDLPGIEQRVVGFPVPPGNYHGLSVASGKVLYLDAPVPVLADNDGGDAVEHETLHIYDLEKRKDLVDLSVDNYNLAPDGSRLIYRNDKAYGVVELKEGIKVGDGKVDLSGLRMDLDPEAEWRQIFSESWRVERDFFYLPDMGGIDWPAMRARYEVLLPYVSHRADLTYVIGEMAGELGSGHSYVGGGDAPHPPKVRVGLLGAELEPDAKAGAWRIERIYLGQNWIESRRSPLTEPGSKAAVGDYLLAVDGKDLKVTDTPYRLLQETVGRTVTLLLNEKPTKAGAREVTVKPLAKETDLKYYNWVEDNRRKVEKATNGRVGYIHIPDMGPRGLNEFIRQYYPQIRKEGLVVDVRANGGGFVSEMILERLRRAVMGMSGVRNGRSSTYPGAAFNGPMVTLLNHYSASDGDIFPYFFREYGLGPLIGTRSWGGVVGIRGVGGQMVDGGYCFVPEFGMYSKKSQWIVENHGVDPDIEVDNLPQDEMAGKDAQLDRAVQEILKQVEAKKPSFPPRPPSKDLVNPKPAGEGVSR
jgi:tricorn protease